MAIVNLNKRITKDWNQYNRSLKSCKSLIFINGEVVLKNVGPASLNITVGDRWYDCSKNKYYAIPEKGLKVKPGKSIIIETKQEFALPYNVFGIIFGTGKNIFKGGFISTGKINPGFHGVLKIGYYNGSDSVIIFNRNDLLACCSFFDIETTLESPLEKYLTEPEPEFEPNTIPQKIKLWLVDNWYAVVSIILSVIAIIFAAK